jgi:hypothetical protein
MPFAGVVMNHFLPGSSSLLAIGMLVLALGGCATNQPRPPEPSSPVVPTLPPAFPPQELVGSWGLAAYHKEEDRARTETAAVNQCRQPYVITLGPTGGVMMYLADQATPTELRLKGAPDGKTFVGPADQPPGSMQDREFIIFNGREMILRWIDPEVQGRYGTMVYVRCAERTGRNGKHKSAVEPERNNELPKPAKPANKPAT